MNRDEAAAKVDRAEAHMKQALDLFDNGNFTDAATEVDNAYKIVDEVLSSLEDDDPSVDELGNIAGDMETIGYAEEWNTADQSDRETLRDRIKEVHTNLSVFEFAEAE